MAKVNFPNSPSDGQTFTSDGTDYIYNSSKGNWGLPTSTSGLQLSGLSVGANATAAGSGDVAYDNNTGVFTYTPPVVEGSSVLLYATPDDLPLVGSNAGDQAYVTSTNRLYIWNGTGWFNIALINTNPTITTGGAATYGLATDGSATTITLTATDPEDVPIAWSYAVTAGSLGSTATISQADNVFTITPSTDAADNGTFSLTFTASDGINTDTSTSAFTLTIALYDWANLQTSDFSTVSGTYSNFTGGEPREVVSSDTHFAYMYTETGSRDIYISVHTLDGALVSNFKADDGTSVHNYAWMSALRIDATRIFLSRAGASSVRVFSLAGSFITEFSATYTLFGDTAPSGGYLIGENLSGTATYYIRPAVFKLYDSSSNLVSTYTIPSGGEADNTHVVGDKAYISVHYSTAGRGDLIILDLTNFTTTTYANVAGPYAATDGTVYLSMPKLSSTKEISVFDLSDGSLLRTLTHAEMPRDLAHSIYGLSSTANNIKIDNGFVFFQTYTNPISNIMIWDLSTGNLVKFRSIGNSGASDNGYEVSEGVYFINGGDGVYPKIADSTT